MSPRTTEQQYQETHEKILNSAEKLFAEKGFNGTSMNDLVEASGISKGAIYGHFRDKERLFMALWERQTVVGIEQARDMFSPNDSAIEKLCKLADITVASSCDCPVEMSRMLLEFMISAHRVPGLSDDLLKRYESVHSFIVEILDEGIAEGEIKPELDVASTASILFATLDGLSLHYSSLGIRFDSAIIRSSLLSIILDGIKA